MKKKPIRWLGLAVLTAAASIPTWAHGDRDDPRGQPEFIPETFSPVRNLQPFANASGALATFNVAGRIDTRNPFFKSLGTNGRSCGTCHVADQAFSITPPEIRERFARTRGRDPLFASVDGANCRDASRSNPADHSLLLRNGLIRVGNTLPAKPEFRIEAVHDPYGCALVVDSKTGLLTASIYRRPLPSTNVSFLSTVMWDGRETLVPLNNGSTFLANLRADLGHQVQSAVSIHAEGTAPPTDKQISDIVDFELGLYTAQTWDWRAGSLDRHGARGGPWNLGNQLYYPGINDSLGAEPTGEPFAPTVMTAFNTWAAPGTDKDADLDDEPDYRRDGFVLRLPLRKLSRFVRDRAAARGNIAAGEKLFNTAPLTITAVRGLNDNAALSKPVAISGMCTTCHDSPNIGHHSLPLPLDIGVGHTAMPGLESDSTIAAGLAELDQPDLPVFRISGCPDPFTGGQRTSFYTTDPGKGLITGLCSDVNRVKGPVLRGLAGRAPYFHNGAAATLLQAVNFYNQRFQMNLSQQQKADLVAFLNSL